MCSILKLSCLEGNDISMAPIPPLKLKIAAASGQSRRAECSNNSVGCSRRIAKLKPKSLTLVGVAANSAMQPSWVVCQSDAGA